MSSQRVLVLVHKNLVPPDKPLESELATADWKTEHDVYTTLVDLGHEVEMLGVLGDLESVRKKLDEFQPNIVFNLLEEFDGNITFDQNVVSYLELKRIPYTGCNPRGLIFARDKALSKKILSYHRVPVPKFTVFPKNQKIRLSRKIEFPLIVKSLTEEASMGISQASVVTNEESLRERVAFVHQQLDTDAIAESYIKGREFYVGILGNKRLQIFPVWELQMTEMPDSNRKFATQKVKWSSEYRDKYGIRSIQASKLSEEEIEKIHKICRKTYKALDLNGYARIDLRYSDKGQVYVLEANPNPGIAYGEEFPESAEAAGMSYEDVIAKILSLGLSWYQSRK